MNDPTPDDPASRLTPGPTPTESEWAYGVRPQVESARALSYVVIGFAVWWTLLQIANAVLSSRTLEQAQQIEAGTVGPLEALTPFDLTMAALGVSATMGAWISTGLWLQRLRDNSTWLAPASAHARSPIWVWLGWIVPVVFFWYPYQVVRDIRRTSVAPERWSNSLLPTWWTLWLAIQLTTQASGQLSVFASLEVLPWVSVLLAFLTVIGCVLWIRVVRELTLTQQVAAAHRGIAVR